MRRDDVKLSGRLLKDSSGIGSMLSSVRRMVSDDSSMLVSSLGFGFEPLEVASERASF